ncbi:MAG: DUF4340 domain-containing protein [Gemmatimonadota bacterium]|nr:DUF4340 domain-containing protein [Gemmatimonadota bacterium]
MSKKTLRACIYSLVAVGALYLVVTLARGGGGGAHSVDPGLAAALEEIAAGPHERFVIEGPEGTILLELDAGAWTANGFEADSSAVARLIRAVEETEVGAIAGTNPANHARFGLSADSAWSFTAGDSSPILLGKTGTRFRTAYVRLPDSDPVSVVEGDLRSAAARPLVDWRDKIVVRADTAAVARISVTHAGGTEVYERQDSAWMVGGEEVEAATVRGILQELASLRASGFAPDGSAMPEAADRSVVATDADGNELASLAMAEQDGNFWLKSAASPYIFEIPIFRANRLAPGAPEEE